jgi:hypothetical protein
MKNFNDSCRRPSRVYRLLLPAVAAMALAACGTTSTASSGAPQLMFVHSAEDLKVDRAAGTFRLVRVTQQTLCSADRPQRDAGHLTMADYLKEWTPAAGKDNFGANPPNAALSVYEPGQANNTLVVVKITNPVVDSADLIYSYKIITGTMPAGGGAPSLSSTGLGSAAASAAATTASARAVPGSGSSRPG